MAAPDRDDDASTIDGQPEEPGSAAESVEDAEAPVEDGEVEVDGAQVLEEEGGIAAAGESAAPVEVAGVRWFTAPTAREHGVFERLLQVMMADPTEAARGRNAVGGWEIEGVGPHQTVFLMRTGSRHFRFRWFDPSVSLARREGLSIWKAPAEQHVTRRGLAERIGVRTPVVTAAGVLEGRGGVFSQAPSFLVLAWPSSVRRLDQLLRERKLSLDDQVKVARQLQDVGRRFHAHGVGNFEFSTKSLGFDTTRGELWVAELHRMQIPGAMSKRRVAERDVRLVNRLCEKLLAGTGVTLADID